MLTAEALQPLGEAKWIRLQKISYTDPSGNHRTWESAERQTRPKNAAADSVGVIAILSHPTAGKSLLLQKQFRPPLNQVTIEVPSGLIDEGEDPATSAIRELKEETGYVATLPKDTDAETAEGFVMFNDPGFCNTNTKMVFVEVDMADPRNHEENLKPDLEENEYIECFTVPLASLWEELGKLEKQGYAIDARVGTLAQGMLIAKKWKL